VAIFLINFFIIKTT